MRTDCTIDLHQKLRLPQIPAFSPGRNDKAGRGDFIRYSHPDDTATYTARVIGIVTAHDLDKPHLCVAIELNGQCCERWVDPEWVWDCFSYPAPEKMEWFWGDKFLATEPSKARRCFDLTVPQMMETPWKL